MITLTRHQQTVYCIHAVSVQQQIPKCFELLGKISGHMLGLPFHDSYGLYLIDGILLALLTDKAVEPVSPVRLAMRICEELTHFGISLSINIRRI